MSLVYRNEVGRLATDCPICGQQVVCERSGRGYRFRCYGGHTDAEVVATLDPVVMLELGRAENGASAVGEAAASGWRDVTIDGAQFALDAPRVVPAVWGAGDQVLWSSEEPCALVGPQGVGKTTVTHRLAFGLLGIDGFGQLLGHPVRPVDGNVLLLALDRPAQIARAMRRIADDSHRDVLRGRLKVWRGRLPFNLLKDPAALARMAVELEAAAVLIDAAKDTGLALNKDDGGLAFNDALQALVAGGVEVAFNHHQRKASDTNPKPKTLADVYGSVWVTAGCGSVVLLWGQPGDPVVELSHLKQPADQVGPIGVLYNHQAGEVRLNTTSAPQIADIVRRAGRPMTVREVARVFYGTDDPNSVEKARRRLESLVRDDGVLERVDERTEFGPRATYVATSAQGSFTEGHAAGSRTPSLPRPYGRGGRDDPLHATEKRDPDDLELATAEQLAEADRIAAKFKRPNPKGDT